ncbi:MAG: hypothetical protein AAF004_03435 [Pseudomonadota bacterium]
MMIAEGAKHEEVSIFSKCCVTSTMHQAYRAGETLEVVDGAIDIAMLGPAVVLGPPGWFVSAGYIVSDETGLLQAAGSKVAGGLCYVSGGC